MKFLVISLAGIGDTLFATPLVHELRANFPEAQIDALVLWPGSKDLLEGNPHLNAVYQKNLIRAGRMEGLRFLWQLRRNRYDVSINVHPQSRVHYRVVARLVNAAIRISHEYDRPSALDRFLVNRSLKQDYERHSVENNLALLSFLGAQPMLPRHDYEIHLSPAEHAWAEEFLTAQQLVGRKLLGIHVGSGGTKNLALRRWPLASYVELIQRLNRDRADTTVLLFGGPEEQRDHQHLLTQVDRRLVFEPRTGSLRQAAALLKKCAAFLSVDTALMHLAAAMKVPGQVVIETPTWNKPIQPYNQSFRLVTNPAVAGRNLDYYRYDGLGIKGTEEELLRCMAGVSVEAVYDVLSQAQS
jgi:ADP-heptose:LPS heptosyltransferase